MAGDKTVKLYSATSPTPERIDQHGHYVLSAYHSKPAATKKKPRGWKAMPYILGNESFERLATFGLMSNFMVYLLEVFHLKLATAANVINIWMGVTNFTPLVGGFISDAYAGRFKTIAFASFATLLGMVAVTLTAWLPQLHPSECDVTKQQCKGPNGAQMAVLVSSLGLMSIGSGGIRPCSIPFGVDQFDQTTEAGVKGIASFFNLYYTSLAVITLITQTAVIYIQDSVSWVLGFGIPTLLMLAAIILFLVGTKIYVLVEPKGSIFSSIAQVLVATFRKRHLKLPDGDKINGVFYDPPSYTDNTGTASSNLPFTNQLRFFNKAAMIVDHDLKPNGGTINPWQLCSIQQVEEVKCLIKIIPISASSIITFTAIVQQSTFIVSQAMRMDRHLGHNFQIPPASIIAITYLTISIWILFYDRIIIPALRRKTKHQGGITVLQRIGIGNMFSILAMMVAGVIEGKRRGSADIGPISVFWLVPPLVLLGFCEAFFYVGFLEFFNNEFPERMKSIGNSLIYCSYGAASYLSSMIITIVHGTTANNGRPDWLANDINAGRLDYFFFVIGGLEMANFIYFVYCACCYIYKGSVQPEEKSLDDIELVGSSTL